MQRAHTPLGARVAAAAVARGRVADARSDHGAQSRLPQRLAPEAPSGVVWACEAAGEAGHRARRGHWVMRARTRGLPNSRPPLALTYRQLLGPSSCETFCATSVKCPWAPATLGVATQSRPRVSGLGSFRRSRVQPAAPDMRHRRVTICHLQRRHHQAQAFRGAPRPVEDRDPPAATKAQKGTKHQRPSSNL